MITATGIKAVGVTATKVTATAINSGGGTTPICRYFSNFDGSNSRVIFDNTISLDGDFEVEVELVTPAISNHWANVLSFDNARLVTRGSNQNKLEFRYLDPVERTMAANMNTDAGVTTAMIIKRSGLVYSLQSIGSTSDIVTYTAPSLVTHELTRIGYDISGIGEKDVFDGQLANTHVWIGGDRNTGTLIVNLPLGEDVNPETGNVDYINITGNTDYNATGYDITTIQDPECAPPVLTIDGEPLTVDNENLTV